MPIILRGGRTVVETYHGRRVCGFPPLAEDVVKKTLTTPLWVGHGDIDVDTVAKYAVGWRRD